MSIRKAQLLPDDVLVFLRKLLDSYELGWRNDAFAALAAAGAKIILECYARQ